MPHLLNRRRCQFQCWPQRIHAAAHLGLVNFVAVAPHYAAIICAQLVRPLSLRLCRVEVCPGGPHVITRQNPVKDPAQVQSATFMATQLHQTVNMRQSIAVLNAKDMNMICLPSPRCRRLQPLQQRLRLDAVLPFEPGVLWRGIFLVWQIVRHGQQQPVHIDHILQQPDAALNLCCVK